MDKLVRDRLLKGLKDAENSAKVKWEPKPGDMLLGFLTRAGAININGEQRDFIEVTPEGKSEAVTVWLNTVLHRWLDETQAGVGDYVAIRFLGIPAGKVYKNYSFATVKNESQEAKKEGK